MARAGGGLRAGVAVTCAALAVTGCAGRPADLVGHTSAARPSASATSAPLRSAATTSAGEATTQPSPSAEATPSVSRSVLAGAAAGADQAKYAVATPGPLTQRLLTPDLLITSSRPLPTSVRRRVAATRGVDSAMTMSLASLSANGRTLSIAAADPATFRRFTSPASAESDAVWQRVAGGEIAVDPSTPRRLEDPAGFVRLGATQQSPVVHIGAYAPLVQNSAITGVVNRKRGDELGIPRDNAMLVSTGSQTPSAVRGRLTWLLGPRTTLETLAVEFAPVSRTAVLSGQSVSSAVGTFTYTPHADGTVTPEASWVRAYIRTEQMPIIGPVTGNKGMLPQLRAALDDVVRSGLAPQIHPGEYGGCYVPRFIANDPAKGLSLHSFGIAVDLNVPGNLRGTVGAMDRRVVAIFKKWGFAWGGDWNYTDPMHFEMASVVKVG